MQVWLKRRGPIDKAGSDPSVPKDSDSRFLGTEGSDPNIKIDPSRLTRVN